MKLLLFTIKASDCIDDINQILPGLNFGLEVSEN